jgi:hypothetical protein
MGTMTGFLFAAGLSAFVFNMKDRRQDRENDSSRAYGPREIRSDVLRGGFLVSKD